MHGNLDPFVPTKELTLINRKLYKKYPNLKDENITLLSRGISAQQTFIVTDTNQVYAIGWNANGQLGIGYVCKDNLYEKVEFFNHKISKISSIVCDSCYTLFLMEDGTVYTCGAAIFNNQSWDNEYDLVSPIKIKQLEHIFIIKVGCTEKNAFFLDRNGILYQSEFEGVSASSIYKDKKIKISDFSCGRYHVGAIDNAGQSYLYSPCYEYTNLSAGLLKFEDEYQDQVDMIEFGFGVIDFIKNRIIKTFCGSCLLFLLDDQNDLYILGGSIDEKLMKYLDDEYKLNKEKIGIGRTERIMNAFNFDYLGYGVEIYIVTH